MSLAGYEKCSGKRSGGIRSIALVSAKEVVGADYTPDRQICTSVSLKPGSRFALYEFKEGQARYTEELTIGDCVTRVRHEVIFTIERPESSSAMAVMELAKATPDGIVAVITTNSNVSFLVGYSAKFGTEQPLQLATATLSTGMEFSDDSKETITLVSDDNSKASVYSGNQVI